MREIVSSFVAILTEISRYSPAAMQKKTVERLPIAFIILNTVLLAPVFEYWLIIVEVTIVSVLRWKIRLIANRGTWYSW